MAAAALVEKYLAKAIFSAAFEAQSTKKLLMNRSVYDFS